MVAASYGVETVVLTASKIHGSTTRVIRGDWTGEVTKPDARSSSSLETDAQASVDVATFTMTVFLDSLDIEAQERAAVLLTADHRGPLTPRSAASCEFRP